MSEFIPSICWFDFDKDIPAHMKLWHDLNIKGMRAFFNTDDIPHYALMPDQKFIQHCFDTMPNPMHAWTYEGNPLPWLQKGKMRDIFDVCKQEKWLPIISFGCQEETPHGWLGRAIPQDKWAWLTAFVYQLGIYLRDTMKFDRVDFEWWNEPSKLEPLGFGWDKYCLLGYQLVTAWKSVSPNYKFYAFSDDILRQDYLNNILKNVSFMNRVDVISTHIGVGSEDNEWDRGLIQLTTQKIQQLYPHLKQSVTELTCNGIISRLNQLPNQTIGYGHIGLNRHLINGNLLGTRMDDYAVWDTNYFRITAPDKISYSANFNLQNYKPYEIKEEDMTLDKIYKLGSKGIGVRFIQKVLNADTKPNPLLITDGVWELNTANVVKQYQTLYGLLIDGIVGPQTMKSMILEYPEIWDEINYEFCIGVR
jgi:hypothetical protein